MGQVSKEMVAVYRPQACSECMACQITCAQLQGGTSRPDNAHIHVLGAHSLFNPTIVLDAGCSCPDGTELCEQVCGPMALRFVARESLLSAQRDGWQTVPVEG